LENKRILYNLLSKEESLIKIIKYLQLNNNKKTEFQTGDEAKLAQKRKHVSFKSFLTV
jgi:hypothetical protein